MKRNVMGFMLILSLAIIPACFIYLEDVEILETDKIFYGPEHATLKATLHYHKLDSGKSMHTAVVSMYNTKSGVKIPIENLDSGKILINGFETKFINKPDEAGFYPISPDFRLTPDSLCKVVINYNNNTYTSTTKIPGSFGGVEIPDTINLAKKLDLTWDNAYPFYKIYVKIVVYNPSDPNDKLVLVDQEYTNINEINLPFEKLAPTIKNWNGSLYVSRKHTGLCDQSLRPESSIVGISSYYKAFALTYRP